MKTAIGFFAAMTLASSAFAADIFVRETKGADLSQRQATEVTDLVKNAVNGMSEHMLVDSESQADFVLQPSIVSRGNEQLLRIEKEKDGDIIAMSEEPINSVNASNDRAMAVTETALQEDQYVQQPNNMASSDEELARDIPASDMAPSSQPSSEQPSQASGMAMDDVEMDDAADDESTRSATTQADASDTSTGEVAAPSPRFTDPDRVGYFQLGVGPAFGISLETDEIMYNVNGSYNMEISEKLVGKGFVDLNLGSGAEEARFINLGLGAEYYMTQQLFNVGRPYVAADIGYAFTRTGEDDSGQDGSKDAPAIGVGAGFKFQAADLNMDLVAHYTILTSQIEEANPQVVGARLAINF